MELEGAVVTAEDEQVREPSSEGQGFTAGSAEASARSRLPPCGDPRLGFRSPGPGADKDIERWDCKILCQGQATTLRPEARAAGHTDRRDKAGLHTSRAVSAREGLAAGPGPPALPLTMGHNASPAQLGENKGRTQEPKRNVGRSPTYYL